MSDLKHKPPSSFIAEESRSLVVSVDTKQHWAVMIDLLMELERVCKKHGIRYFADGGTLLGAARHDGFIPWDDDVDVAMLRDDYEKLKLVAGTEFRHPYFFQTNDTDREWFQSYGRLCNDETTAIAKANLCNGKTVRRSHQGIFIDIFPLDKIPDDRQERVAFLRELSLALGTLAHRAKALLTFRRPTRRIWVDPSVALLFLKGGAIVAMRKILQKDLVREAYKAVHKIGERYNTSKSRECGECTFLPDLCEKIRFPVGSYENSTEVLPFEYTNVHAPKGYERYLEMMFGNWHRHVIGGGLHGEQFIDVYKSWKEYL